MTVNLDRRLADLRREPGWTPEQRAAVLDSVLEGVSAVTSDPVRRRRPVAARSRRRIVLAAVTGLAAAACVAAPALLPSGSPGSADQAHAVAALHQLARIAAVSPADDLEPGQYLHIVHVGHQEPTPGQSASSFRYESWTQADGKTWQRRTERGATGAASNEVWVWAAGPQVIDGMTAPVYLDQLPTDPAQLEAFVLAHTSGSTSGDERVFVAVNDIVRSGLASPTLRSAAIDVLTQLGRVRLGKETHDSLGHPVQSFDFVDPAGRPDEMQTVMFDTRTAQVTEDRDYFDGDLHEVTTTSTFDVVDSVPASVLASAVPQN